MSNTTISFHQRENRVPLNKDEADSAATECGFERHIVDRIEKPIDSFVDLEWEAYCHGSHGYQHDLTRGKTSDFLCTERIEKVAACSAVGSWDDLMSGAR